MELRAIKYALAVADSLHFGRAAEHVRVAQPSLSRQIAALEREIGAVLFDRTSRRVALSEAGAQFFPAARRALADLETAAQLARQAQLGRSGQLLLGFVATAALDVLPDALARFSAQRPNVRVLLSERTSAEQIGQILAGELDVGIGRDVVDQPGLRVDVIRREPICLAVADGHRLAGAPSVDLNDVAGCPVVRLPPGVAPRADVLLAVIRGRHRSVEPSTQVANHYMTVLALVSAGMGVACVPYSVRQLRPSGVSYLCIDHLEATTSLTLARRRDDDGPIVSGFCDLLLG